ncbi:MAG: hypothetical protein K0R39_2680 [Symbiobacteriaceae bacterium]|jgi:Flp pilus assembly protein TadG|nr:hypothetical protein [Symbiobacteriaceae bacterium]
MVGMLRKRQEGVAMVEATIGTVLLLFAALGTLQLVLVFHGALAGHTAVIRAARTMAITQDQGRAQQTFQAQMSTALRGISGGGLTCNPNPPLVSCTATIFIPSIMPGAGLFTGDSIIGPISITHTGSYPYGANSGN